MALEDENPQYPIPTGGIDIEGEATKIGAEIFADLGNDDPPHEDSDSPQDPEQKDPDPALAAPPQGVEKKDEGAPAAPTPRQPPKSWMKEVHDGWSKLTPEMQDYIERREEQMGTSYQAAAQEAAYARTLKEVAQPYEADIVARGGDLKQAMAFLLNADKILTHGTAEQKVGFLAETIARAKVDPAKLLEAVNAQPQGRDPRLDPVLQRVQQLEQQATERDKAVAEEMKGKINREIDDFAKDPAHPYFDEVAPQVILLLQDPSYSLAQAYEAAVYANPSTRAKELARISKESEEKLRKDAKEAAEKARQRKGANVRGRATDRTPTEPTGTIDDTLRETLAAIKARETA